MTEFINHVLQLAAKVLSNFLPKCAVWIVAAPLFLFDSIKTDAMIAVVLLVIFDFITAISAAIKVKEPIESAKVRRTAIKLFLYSIMVSGGHLVDVSLNGLLPFDMDSIVISFLAITELISIFENVRKSGYDVPTNLIKFLKEKITKTEVK